MQKLKRRVTTALLAALLSVSCGSTAHAYTDTQSHWAAQVIEKAGEYGLMEGYPDGRFGVGDPMTRAQFVTVLSRLFSWQAESVPDAPALSDCSGHWAQAAIYAAVRHGAAEPAGAFRPDDYISRAEMAQMLVKALGYDRLAQTLSGVQPPFADVTQDAGYIAIASDLGIINGVSENGTMKFLPTFSATREQAAAMLVRCYERYTSKTRWLHGFYAISSYDQIGYTDVMDAVSVGWCRLEPSENGVTLNETATNNNEWVKPEGAGLVTQYLAERSIPCNLNVFSSADTFEAMMVSSTQAETVNRLADAARPYAGLTIDFEGLKSARREDFTAFMTALRSALPEQKALWVCVPPDLWFGGYDYRALGDICARVILMAHDYAWSVEDYFVGTGKTDNPVTPIDKVYTTLQHITDPETGVRDPDKIAMQISFNTAGFHVDENGLLLERTLYHPGRTTIALRLEQPDTVRVWDEPSQNPYIEYRTEDAQRYKLWYEDAQSVAAKLQLARMFGITGVSVWRLGAIPDFAQIPNYNVWEVLSQGRS